VFIPQNRGLENILATTYALLRMPLRTAGYTENPIDVTDSVAISESLQVKLLTSFLFHNVIAHNSPEGNENEETAGIYNNYIQYFDDIVRNWSTLNIVNPGMSRLRTIYNGILTANRDKISDPVYVKNHGTLAEYGEAVKDRKNYAFYEGYSRLDIDLERPVYGTNEHSGVGLMFRISENVELYKVNGDSIRMFDTSFLNGSNANCLLVSIFDSISNDIKINGLWLKGIDSVSNENFYTAISGVRIMNIKFRISPFGSPFNSSSHYNGDAISGKFIRNGEHSIFRIREMKNNGTTIDTIDNDKMANIYLHGQSKLLEIDSAFVGGDSIEFFKIENDSNVGKVSIINKTKYSAVFQDTATFDDLKLAVKIMTSGNMDAIIFYFNSKSKKLLSFYAIRAYYILRFLAMHIVQLK
jgi:hypothetical protein